MKKFLALFLAVVFSAVLSGCGGDTVNIIYSASLNGNLSGCDCYGYPVAGLVKRVSFLRSYDHSDEILLDAGNIMEAGPDPLLTGSILEFYDSLDYDAISVGNQEFAEGVDSLLEYKQHYPFIADNLLIKKDGTMAPFNNTALRINRAGLVIGIISIIDEDIFRLYPEEFMGQLEIQEPDDVVQRIINGGLNEVDLWIVLFHGYRDNAIRLGSFEPRITAIIFGHEEMLAEQVLGNGVLLLSPGEEGNRLGRLELKVKNGKVVYWENEFELFHYIDSPDDPEALAAAKEYKKQLRDRIRARS